MRFRSVVPDAVASASSSVLSHSRKGAVPRVGARIVAHHGGGDRIGAHRIQSGDQHSRLHDAHAANPGPSPPAMDSTPSMIARWIGPRRRQIGHDVRYAISGIVVGAGMQFLRRRLRQAAACPRGPRQTARWWGFSFGSSTPASSP